MKRSTFGAELRKLRGDSGKTMSDLAEAIECSIVYISDIERSKRNPPSPKKIRLLLKCLGALDEYSRMLTLASKDRMSVEIPLKNGSSNEVTDMLVALARRADDGSIDTHLAEQIKKLLEDDKDNGSIRTKG